MSEQKPSIGRSVHVRTEGGCLPGVIIATAGYPDEAIQAAVFTGGFPELKNVIEKHSPTGGWHWYHECPDKQ